MQSKNKIIKLTKIITANGNQWNCTIAITEPNSIIDKYQWMLISLTTDGELLHTFNGINDTKEILEKIGKEIDAKVGSWYNAVVSNNKTLDTFMSNQSNFINQPQPVNYVR